MIYQTVEKLRLSDRGGIPNTPGNPGAQPLVIYGVGGGGLGEGAAIRDPRPPHPRGFQYLVIKIAASRGTACRARVGAWLAVPKALRLKRIAPASSLYRGFTHVSGK